MRSWTHAVVTMSVGAVIAVLGSAEARAPDLLGAFALPAAPALPPGCATPTKDQCASAAFYASDACAKDPAKAKAVQGYCVWALQKAWTEVAAAPHPVIFPKDAPNSVNPILGAGRRVDNGKTVPAVKVPRPAERRRYTGKTRRATGALAANAPAAAMFSPTVAKPGTGSFASLSAPSVLPTVQLGARPSWVSAGPTVSSCEEYTYKRWGEYSAFQFAALRAGQNYRQVYDLATNPGSGFFVNKLGLVQTGVSTPIPKQLDVLKKGYPEPWLPANAFIVGYPDWLKTSSPASAGRPIASDQQRQQILMLVDKQWPNISNTGNMPRRVKAKSDASPLGLHREAKALFDSKYQNPLDDELADAAKRSGSYQNLYAERAELLVDRVCADVNDPCFLCRATPTAGLPGVLQKLKDRLTGAPIVNPSDLKDALRGSRASHGESLDVLSKLAPALRDMKAVQAGAAGATKGLKQKSAPLDAQIKLTIPGSVDEKQCRDALAAKAPRIDAAIAELEADLTRMLVNELSLGDRGCLADPGTDIANLCDWSYEKLAKRLTTVFEGPMNDDLRLCRRDVGEAIAAVSLGPNPPNGFTTVVKNPPMQKLILPCTQRRDFTGSAPDVRRFLELSLGAGKACEAAVQNLSIDKQQAAIAEQMEGMAWKRGEGAFGEGESDSLTLGDKDWLGAYLSYDASWEMTKTQTKGGDPMMACRFEGKGRSVVKAGIYFFGDDLELLKVDGAGAAKSPATVSLSASYFDIDTLSSKSLASTANKQLPAGETYAVNLSDPPILLGGTEYSFWVAIGPVPVKITFGAQAKAGLDYRFQGAGGDNCADVTKSSGFALVSEVDPWVRGDAYAEAAVDVLVASAGVRLDLTLMQVSLPMGVRIQSSPAGYSFKNGGHVGIDMLSGSLTGFVDIGVWPNEVSYEVKLFSWDGFHADLPAFGLDKSLSQQTTRIAMAGQVNSNNVTCKCTQQACCSNLSCPTCAGAVDIGGTKYLCTFSQADYQTTLKKDPTLFKCQPFVK